MCTRMSHPVCMLSLGQRWAPQAWAASCRVPQLRRVAGPPPGCSSRAVRSNSRPQPRFTTRGRLTSLVQRRRTPPRRPSPRPQPPRRCPSVRCPAPSVPPRPLQQGSASVAPWAWTTSAVAQRHTLTTAAVLRRPPPIGKPNELRGGSRAPSTSWPRSRSPALARAPRASSRRARRQAVVQAGVGMAEVGMATTPLLRQGRHPST
mmetsp:Transcript_52903/g.138743  ORF Transcript_52903/g.138743 Transcript_52903/m.138743 type:complete len:205 (+) Transcript_52903:403-1017(+)